MKQPFKYAVLQYRPSYLLDERVNVGLLFHFVEEKTVEFVFPEHLSRINHLFPGEEPHLLRQYLRSFKNETLGLNKNPLYLNQIDLTASLLTPDANAFCFSDWKTGLYADRQATLAHYQKLFFKYYGETSFIKIRHNGGMAELPNTHKLLTMIIAVLIFWLLLLQTKI